MVFQRLYPLFFIIFFLSCFNLYAQDGSLFLTSIDAEESIRYTNWSVAQDKYNNMFFANRKGIMIYDGETWELIKTPSMPYKLHKHPSTERIFVGCNADYGYLERNKKGFYQYFSLANDTLTPGEFMQIEDVDSVIYFMSDKYFASFDPEKMEHRKRWYARENSPFTGIIHNRDHVFVNVWNSGLHRLQSDTLFPIVSGFYIKHNEIIFDIPYSNNRILLGTDDNELYLFDGMKFYNYQIDHNDYLRESFISGAISLSDTSFALATLSSGVVIMNKQTNKIEHIINYQTGLPDNEVFSLGLDNNNGLWVSHGSGVSRVPLGLPVRNFTVYPGLEGKVNNVSELAGNIYVATGEGVYYLMKEEEYAEKKITVKVEEPVRQKKQEKKEEKDTGKLKSFFNKIFKSEDEDNQQEEQIKTRKRVSYRTRKIKELKSVSHKYKKIKGIDGKCEHLVVQNNHLLAGTNYGVYHVDTLNDVNPLMEGNYIYQIIPYNHNDFMVATRKGIFRIKCNDDEWSAKYLIKDFNKPVYSLSYNYRSNILWAGGDNCVYKIEKNETNNQYTISRKEIGSNYPKRYYTGIIDNKTYLFSSSNIFVYNERNNSFIVDSSLAENTSEFEDFNYIFNQKNLTWFHDGRKWNVLNDHIKDKQKIESYLRLFDKVKNVYIDTTNLMYVVDNNIIYRIDLNKKIPEYKNFNVFYSHIKKNDKDYFRLKDFKVYKESIGLSFRMSAPDFLRDNSVHYQYKIQGMMDDWSDWTEDPEIKIFTRKGKYTIKARAKNIWGQVSEAEAIHFEVPPPFIETPIFYVITGVGLVLLIVVFIKLRERKLMHDKRILEGKVKERTATIEEQKEEITAQRDQILETKNQVQRKNKEITDSIEYASRIQNALLPLKDHFYKAFQDHFILFKPRDIVSGDFYWIYRKDHKIYVTAADCTGHGVPGAFMSLLGISFLNEIVSHDKNSVYNAADILNNLRAKVKKSLHQENISRGTKDGMDMGLCIIDKKKNMVDFAGAYNPMILFRDGQMQEIKADRMPVGVFLSETDSFTNQRIEVKPGDTFYIFSDGYVDQFGGPKGKKFKRKALLNLLQDIYDRSMEEQLRILNHNFEEWKGTNFQVDDVILMGIRL
jgi:serine phosphatase RsbU (regulator of sigma subunit)/ligand-binding sensor domain-containing protein